MKKETQMKKILKAMIMNKDKVFTAKDFQHGEYFVGYEASARMSDLMRIYPGLFLIGKQDRFRTLQINCEYADLKTIIEYVME